MSANVHDSILQSGREYHETDSVYVLPNDTIEQDRLDVQAGAIVEMIGGTPFKAQLNGKKKITRAVDVGCGTGIASIQFASMFPNTKVYGVDISPVPESIRMSAPKNVTFALGNILNVRSGDEGNKMYEIFTPGSLDYIFGRMLFLGVNDWKTYFSVVSDSLSPGGLVEHQDLDWKFYRAQTNDCLSDDWEWHRRIMAANGKSGLSNSAGSGAESHMRSAGLEVLSVQRFEFSFTPSDKTPASKRMGRYVQEKLMPNYPELLRKMLCDQNLAPGELERLQKECLEDLGTSADGIHQKYTVTIARKP